MIVKKRYLLTLAILLLTLLFPANAAAGETTANTQTAGFFFAENIEFNGEAPNAVNILLFCDSRINDANAIFIAAGGNISVNGSVDGAVLTLFTKTVSTAAVKYGIINLRYALLFFDLLLGTAFIAVFRDLSGQAAAYLEKNKKGALKFGFYGYIMALLLAGIFFVSVSGAVLAIAGLLGVLAITMAGHIPVSVVLANNAIGNRLKKYNIYTLFIAGSIALDAVKMIPVIGEILMFIAMPIVSLGVFSVLIIHKHFYKAYVSVDFEKSKSFNRKSINTIIYNGIDKVERGESD